MNELIQAQLAAMATVGREAAMIMEAACDSLRIGREVVFTGIGKSGHVAQTAAATWTSVGLVSRFIHPVEALHGDMASITDDAVIIALSQSGTGEVLTFIEALDKRDGPHHVVALTEYVSPLAHRADLILLTTCEEMGPLPVPFISMAMQRAWLDAICFRWMQRFNANTLLEDYAGNHPGGRIGKELRS